MKRVFISNSYDFCYNSQFMFFVGDGEFVGMVLSNTPGCALDFLWSR